MTARARGAADPTRADARVPKNEAGLVTPQTSAYAELPPMRVPEGSGGARFPHLGDSLTAFRAGRSRRATPSQPPMRCARDDPHRGPIAAFIRCTMPIVGPRWGRVGNSMGNTHYVTMLPGRITCAGVQYVYLAVPLILYLLHCQQMSGRTAWDASARGPPRWGRVHRDFPPETRSSPRFHVVSVVRKAGCAAIKRFKGGGVSSRRQKVHATACSCNRWPPVQTIPATVYTRLLSTAGRGWRVASRGGQRPPLPFPVKKWRQRGPGAPRWGGPVARACE